MTALRRIIAAPVAYVLWAGFVALALVGTYPVDPYVFGLTALALAWMTGAIAVCGIVACLLPGATSAAAKVIIIGSVAAAALAVSMALHLLEGFNWA